MDLSEDSRMLMFAPEQTRVRLMDPQQVPLLNEARKDLFRFDCQWNDQASRFFFQFILLRNFLSSGLLLKLIYSIQVHAGAARSL